MRSRLTLLAIIAALALSAPALAQVTRDTETTVIESASYVSPTSIGKVKVSFIVIVENPYEDQFASSPSVRMTARAADSSVITTQTYSSAGIPPKSRIAFCGFTFADEMPAKIEIRPLAAHYEPTVYRSSDFLPFELVGVRSRTNEYGAVHVTGEVKNPYPGKTSVWITFLYRDGVGKLLGGHTTYADAMPGEPTPFELYISADEIPPGVKKIEQVVFDENNYQDSWKKLLRK